ncbi:IS200/IS605 family element transposase accessory protein TnpB [bacterium]|uniref:Transposase n=3 Tax=Candidatus Nealsoniibacteriota TaxID=1817911 RepID=A0A2M7EBN5_9BACT|nr:IS200/IS605 family element transposase accessory protein TnpB [bacterium]PIV65129.1 MAG: transposase [Candidatus Nealsonbacteria bacterium CG01_land_8_20_14_3_00_12]PIW35172.1 MAG: transposase [Candidatus Nealsonbacteria bacterium CG15_BIG_FIL_POST_REV_8_21_14_020_37_12]PJA82433.1 MAG: transposase [Candidatus Nealsonbacteria bacterium CG_4_9_14_3_um_filter_37_29]
MYKQILKKTYKYRLYPTERQQDILEKQLSLCRWLYNHFLEERKTLYEKSKTKITCFDQIREIPELKKGKPELGEVYSQTLQDVVRRLDKAFQNFFRRVKKNKNGEKQNPGYPRFKGYWRYDSIVYPQSGFQLKEDKLNLSKIGNLKIELHRPVEGNVKILTLRRTSTNKWYACFSVEINKELPKKKKIKKVLGIDVGLNSFLTTNQGEKIDNPRYLIKSEEKLSQIQRWHSRKKLKSNNRSKSRLKVAKLHEKITNQRIDFLHKLSHKLVKNFRLIAFEKLNIKGMTKNKYLAKSIIDTSWAHFLQQLTYKAAEAGVWAVGVNPKNTTQVCSGCKNIVPKTLATRKHKCPLCGLTIDRDVNAARNILQLALDTVGTTEINACGVRRILPTMKQEATGFNRW